MRSSISAEPKELQGPAELDAYLEGRVGALASGVPEFPILIAGRGRCPGCGASVPPDGPNAPFGMTAAQLRKAGRTACLCKRCGFPLRRWKRLRTDGRPCWFCGEPVPEADPTAESVTCALCLSHRADLLKAGKSKRTTPRLRCTDCDSPLPLGRQRHGRCDRCRRKRRRESWRRSKRKAGQHSTPSPSQTPVNIGRNGRDSGPNGRRSSARVLAS